MACVVPQPGARVTEVEVLGHLQGRLARYKQPLRVVVWQELPRSGYGKIPKMLVKRRLEAEGVAF